MTQYMTLLGADDVRSAGYMMLRAAEQMNSAAAQMEESLRRHEAAMGEILDDHAARIEAANEEAHRIQLLGGRI